MKRCPACGRTFTNNTLTACLNDGTLLVEDVPDTVSYFGAPMAASPEPFSPFYPEDDSLGEDEEDPTADFEELPPATVSPQAPAFGMPPYAAPPVMQGTPPPYFAAQARRKEAPWGGILLLCFLGVLAGIFGLVMFHSGQGPASSRDSPPATVPSTAADTVPNLFPGLKLDDTLTQTPDGTLRQSLIAAVKDADAADAESLSTLDPAPLRSFYAGPALAGELDEIQSLKQAGTTQKSRLVAQRFKDFQVNPAHTKAQVDVAEKWSTITRSKASGKVTHKDPPNTSSQVISLTHTAHGWVIENIQFYEL